MEPQSPESRPQEKGDRSKETVLPPEIIRPLGRAMRQTFSRSIKAVRKDFKQLEHSDLFSQPNRNLVNSALDEVSNKLVRLEKAKEVRLVEKTTPETEDIPTFEIECSEELEGDIKIPPSTTVINKDILEKLGPALQDYLINPFTQIRMQGLPFPDQYKQYVEDIRLQHQTVLYILRAITRASKLTIKNDKDKSKIHF